MRVKSKPEWKIDVTGLKYVMLVTMKIKIPVAIEALYCPSKAWAILDSAGSKQGCRQHIKKKITSQEGRATSISKHNGNKLKQ